MKAKQPMDPHLTNLGQHLRQAAICIETRYSQAMDYEELCTVSREAKQMREKLEEASEESWMRNLARVLPETGSEREMVVTYKDMPPFDDHKDVPPFNEAATWPTYTGGPTPW